MVQVDGDQVVALEVAAATGSPFPAHLVPDTPQARQLFTKIQQEIAAMPKGVIADVPDN
jgi:hypothetical protein